MQARRVSASAAALAMIAGGICLAAAPAATAADLGTSTAHCALSSQTLDVTGAQGDTLTVLSGGPADCTLASSTPGVVTWVSSDPAHQRQDPSYVFGLSDYSHYPPSGPSTVITITLAQVGTTTWTAEQRVRTDHGTVAEGLTLNITVRPSRVWAGQSYARASATDTCRNGWSASWEQWPHGGTGGWVCTLENPPLG